MKKITQLVLITFLLFYANVECQAQNYGLSFDGINDYVQINSNVNMSPTDAVTIEAWVKGNSNDNSSIKFIYDRIETNDGYGLTVTSAGNARITINGGGVTATSVTNVLDGSWNHIAGTYDQVTGLVNIYVNGILEGSSAYSSLIAYSPEPRNGIGGPGVAQNFFKGEIGEVRVWNYARSQAEIQSNMCVLLDETLHPGLIGYWLLNEGTGTVASDNSLNGNDGMLLNGVAWITAPFSCTCTMPSIVSVSSVLNDLSTIVNDTTYVHTFIKPAGLIGGGSGPEFTIEVSSDATFSDINTIRTLTGNTASDFQFRYLCPQTHYYARAKLSSESGACYGSTVMFYSGDKSATEANSIRYYDASGAFSFTSLSVSSEPTIDLNFTSNPTLETQVGIRVTPQGTAPKYRVQISTDPNFSPFSPSSSEPNATSTHFWSDHGFNLQEGIKYYVRATYEGQGVGNSELPMEIPAGETCSLPSSNNLWGRTVTFVTSGAPSSLQTPQIEVFNGDESNFSMNSQIQSTKSDDATLYRFKLEDVLTGDILIYESPNRKMKLKNVSPAPKYNTIYNVSVQATDGVYTTPYGDVGEITTQQSPDEFGISVSPNPSSNQVNVQIYNGNPGGNNNQANIKIIDSFGVIHKNVNTGASTKVIDISDLQVGVYVVVVTRGANIASEQLQVIP